MARARVGGAGSGYAVALVLFAAGFVICLLLAIIFWAQLGSAREDQQTAVAALRRFVSQADEARPEVTALMQPGSTVVRALLDENRELKRLTVGEENAQTANIRQQKEQRNIGVPLMAEIDGLRATLEDARRQIAEAQRQRDDAANKAAQAVDQMTQQGKHYQEAVAELDAKIAKLNQDLQAYRGATGQVEQQAVAAQSEIRRTLDARIVELESQLQQARGEIARLTEDLRRATGGETPLPEVSRPDGQITSVQADERRVYINRGRRDRILLGMTFEVFEQGELVRLGQIQDADQEVRGKATIEVIDVQDNSALARIVRTERGASPVDAGDEIVNLVYDPNQRFRFFVYGDFDIDRTGEPQVTDKRRIESMITRWGGEVAENLSYDVDFLVLGAEPPLPEPLPPNEIDPVKIAEAEQARRNFETYQQLIGQASDLNIPILNQNRFLDLVGYYQR